MLRGGFQRAPPVPRRLWLRQRLVSQLVAAEDFLAFKDLRASSALLVSKRVVFFFFFSLGFFLSGSSKGLSTCLKKVHPQKRRACRDQSPLDDFAGLAVECRDLRQIAAAAIICE